MRRHILLLLLILGTVSFGIDIERPWNQASWGQNVDDIIQVPGFEVFIGINNFQESLNQTNMRELTQHQISNEKVTEKMNSAITDMELASVKKVDCWNGVEGKLNSTDTRTWDYKPEMVVLRESASRLVPPYGKIIVSLWYIVDGMGKTAACTEYPWHWKDAMDNSLDALELSISEAETAKDNAWIKYEEMVRLGLCDEGYNGPGSTECKDAESAFKSTSAGGTELEYGGLAYSIQSAQLIEGELRSPPPDMTNYSAAMTSIWAETGAIAKFESLENEMRLAIDDAETEYTTKKSTADAKKDSAEDELSKLKAENLDRIDEGLEAEHTSDMEVGTIAERYSALEKTNDGAKEDFATIISKYDAGKLALAITNAESAIEDFDEIKNDARKLAHDARKVMEMQKENAKEELDELKQELNKAAQSETFITKVTELEDDFESCKDEATIGDKYACYRNVENDAEDIKETPPIDYNEQTENDKLIAEIKNLIDSAAIDGIPVEGEEAELNTLEKQKDIVNRTKRLYAIKNRIIESAEVMYGELDSRRAELKKRIFLAGSVASDITTTMNNYEKDIVFEPDGTIDFGKSIGHLKALESGYDKIEEELQVHIKEIVAGSMRGRALVHTGAVRLDEPTTITLDIQMKNIHNYEAENVEVGISLPFSMELMMSDIILGEGEVLGITTGEKTATFRIRHAGPFETIRITMEKEQILAHILETERMAIGLGDGSARVDQEIEFDLDQDVDTFVPPEGAEDAIVDGRPIEFLSAGEHTLEYYYLLEDAYTERKENIRAYQAGLYTDVSYEIVINPAIDIDRTVIYLDSINDSRITWVDAYAVTGEKISNAEQISYSTYAAEVEDLREGIETRVRFRYKVEDLEGFVDDQLDLLDNANHTEEVEVLIEDAKVQAGVGNHTEAIEKIEEAKDIISRQNKDTEKKRSKYDEIRLEIEEELMQINTALDTADGLGLDSTFTSKLKARKNELNLRLNESSDASPRDALQILDDVDQNWMKKELRSLHKDLYSEYNDLRQRYSETGNTTTSTFMDFENELNRLGAGMRPEYGVRAEHYLVQIRADVETKEEEVETRLSSANQELSSLERSLEKITGDYSDLRDSAEGTAFSAFFDNSGSRAESLAEEVSELIKNKESPELVEHELARLQDMKSDMEGTIDLMHAKAEDKYNLVRDMLATKEGLSDEKRSEIEKGLISMRNMIDGGSYVDAITLGDSMLAYLGEKEEEDHSLLILGITAVVVLATIIIYVMQHQKELGIGKKEKPVRKLSTKDEEKE